MRLGRFFPLLLGFSYVILFPACDLSEQDVSPGQSHRNLGKGYYEQGEYDRAAAEFLEVLKLEDGTARDHFNAGMALLQSADYDRALGSFITAQQLDPDLPAVDFGLGVLHKRLQRYPEALRAFQRVAARDPEDPCTWFNIGAVYFSMNRFEEAGDAFGNVLAIGFPAAQNFYVSSLFRQATLLTRQEKPEEARELFAEFEPLREQVPSVSLTPSALENGKHSEIAIPLPSEDAPLGRPVTPQFSATGSLRFAESPCHEPPAVAQGDYDGDGRVDLFFSNPCGPGRLFRNGGEGSFSDVTREAGLGEPPPSVNAAFVDHENQGFPSLLVLGEEASRLYLNREGRFTDESAGSGLNNVAVRRGSSSVAFDFDNDGQLDLFLTGVREGNEEASRVHLYRNSGDGSFLDVSSQVGLRSLVGSDWRAADFADFDNDGFSDVLLVGRGASALLLRNQGGERFLGVPVALGSTMRGGDTPRIQVEDFDRDGWFDAMVSGEGGYAILANRQGERLESAGDLPLVAPHGRGGALAIDANADGWIDLLFQDATGGFHLLVYRRGGWEEIPLELAADATGSLAAGDLDPRDSVHLLLAGADGMARLYQRTSPARPSWLRVHLKGDRSNRQGVGAVLEAKAGTFYQKRLSRGLPMTIFTSGRDRLDVVRVTWSNAVIQNELEVDASRTLEIIESDRQTSSCPFLYIWDGSNFRFLTDVVGRAPLGERLPDGTLLRPNPEDYVRIPPNTMKARDGRYDFQLTEELRELAYLDALELLVVDHPVGTEVFADERFSGPPFADFRVYSVAGRRAPVSATDDLGRDVLPSVSRRDAVYTQTERGAIPGIVEEHALILDPGELPDADDVNDTDAATTVRLFLAGWVYWANSSAMRALSSNSGVPFHPPQLQVRDGRGRWVTVIEDLGLPSGMDRTLVADLTGKFLSEDHSVRIVTNLDVHWDEAFFSIGGDDNRLSVHRLSPVAADLHYRGFSNVVRERGGSTPDFFDYSRLMPAAPWNAAAGLYSNYGDVLDLIAQADDEQVVMAPGDEMTVSFDATAVGAALPGRQRNFLLRITGWAKDNEPTTLFFDRVEPLPFIGMTSYGESGSSREGRGRRTRPVPFLVPPLAPIR